MTVIVRKVSERLKKARENAKLHRDYLIKQLREEEKSQCAQVLKKKEYGKSQKFRLVGLERNSHRPTNLKRMKDGNEVDIVK